MAHFITTRNETIYIEDEISFKMISPLKEKKNSYSLPFNIPVTPENSLLFQRAEIIDARNNKTRTLEGTLILDIISFTGVLKITKILEKYRCNFTGQGRVNYILNNNNLTEIDLGTVEIPEFTGKSLSDIEEFYFDINGEKAFCFPPFQNEQGNDNFPFDKTSSGIYNHFQHHPYLPGSYPSAWYYVPAYFINFLVKHILTNLDISIGENALDNVKFENLFILSDYIISTYNFTESEGDEFQWDITEIIIDEDNEKVILQLEEKYIAWLFIYDHVKIYDLNIEEKNNYEGRLLEIEEIDYDNYQITVSIDHKEIREYTGNIGKIRRVQRSIVLDDTFQMHISMPNITAGDLISAIENLTGTILIPSESKNEISFFSLKDILLSGKITDISDYSGKLTELELNAYDGYEILYYGIADEYYDQRVKNIGKNQAICDPVDTKEYLPFSGNENLDIRFVSDESNYYLWNTSNYGSRQLNSSTQIYLGSWMFFSVGLWKNDPGENNLQIKINAAPIVKGNGHRFYASGFRVPRMDIPLNSAINSEYSDTGIRVAFLNELTDRYPLATLENNYISLIVEGEKGLYQQCYKEYIEWKLNRYRECTGIIYWPYHILSSFPWQRKFRVKDTNYFALEINLRQKGSQRIEFDETILARI